MALDHVIIIGAGQGGFQAAASLRQEGYQGRITMIGEEPGLPYQRPPLSKAYMKDADPERLRLRPAIFFEQNQIGVIAGMRVDRIDRHNRTIKTAAGETLQYDHLILATGTRNAVPPVSGIENDRVLGLRTMADADRLSAAMEDAKRIIIIGGGFIGLEFAAVARTAGREVVVLEAANRLMERAVSPEMSEHFHKIHETRGTDIRMGQPVVEVTSDPRTKICCARLGDGEHFEGDFILLAAGVRPNQELAEAAGLQTENGIVVDNFLVSSDPLISALGDCAAFPDPATGARIRLESVQAASDHAKMIAKRLTGKQVRYDAIPWFWSDQFEVKLQIAGLAPADSRNVAKSDDEGRFRVYRFAEDRLVCVETADAAKEHMAARKLLASSSPISLQQLQEHDFQLVALMGHVKK
ncbi:NAD(P)/FAD-dependent oxidoreductase [Roseibium litorale]|uniref:FAD-dependent oxidoreductase n=1 Tax=Roseibium litorale TaxID=2803841 RepID=A0ABR9CSE4_9HYPH|nr:FAD-dependent oxidoreductase [Roseibium litorale]MBD8893673.1 FAD-dependent oxidoreductase [Roseibium litorale]